MERAKEPCKGVGEGIQTVLATINGLDPPLQTSCACVVPGVVGRGSLQATSLVLGSPGITSSSLSKSSKLHQLCLPSRFCPLPLSTPKLGSVQSEESLAAAGTHMEDPGPYMQFLKIQQGTKNKLKIKRVLPKPNGPNF